MLKDSPRYQAELEALKRSTGQPYEKELIRDRMRADVEKGVALHPLDIDKIIQTGQQSRQTDLEKIGLRRNPTTGSVEIDPNWLVGNALVKSAETAAVKQKEAEQAVKKVTVTDPATGQLYEVEATLAEAGAINRGEGSDRLGIPGTKAKVQPGGPGVSATGTPVYTPEQRAMREQLPKAMADQLVQKDQPAAKASAETLAFAAQTRKLLDAGVFAGSGATFKLNYEKAKAYFGWSDAEAQQKITSTEQFLANQARQVGAYLKTGAFGTGSSITNVDREYVADMLGGNTRLEPETLRKLLETSEAAAKWQLDRYNKQIKAFDPKGDFGWLRVDESPLQLPTTTPGSSRGNTTAGGNSFTVR